MWMHGRKLSGWTSNIGTMTKNAAGTFPRKRLSWMTPLNNLKVQAPKNALKMLVIEKFAIIALSSLQNKPPPTKTFAMKIRPSKKVNGKVKIHSIFTVFLSKLPQDAVWYIFRVFISVKVDEKDAEKMILRIKNRLYEEKKKSADIHQRSQSVVAWKQKVTDSGITPHLYLEKLRSQTHEMNIKIDEIRVGPASRPRLSCWLFQQPLAKFARFRRILTHGWWENRKIPVLFFTFPLSPFFQQPLAKFTPFRRILTHRWWENKKTPVVFFTFSTFAVRLSFAFRLSFFCRRLLTF